MQHRIALLPLPLVLPLITPATARTEASSARQVDTIAHGVKLSLILPRSTYPRGVLTRATVRIQNLSRQSLTILPGFTDRLCAADNPQIQSMSTDGKLRFPPAVLPINSNVIPPCTGGGPSGFSQNALLSPGASQQGNVTVVLWGRYLRAVATLAPAGPDNRPRGHSFTVVGRMMTLQLAQDPPVQIKPCSAAYSCLKALPAMGARVAGPLYYAYSAQCEDAKGTMAYQQDARFEVTGNSTLHIGCNAPFRELHVVAGWLNQPLGRIDRTFSPPARRGQG